MFLTMFMAVSPVFIPVFMSWDALDVEGVQSKNFRGYSRGLGDSLGFRSHHRGVAIGLLGRRRFLVSAIFNLSDLV
jgi:hypothetical protein